MVIPQVVAPSPPIDAAGTCKLIQLLWQLYEQPPLFPEDIMNRWRALTMSGAVQ